MPVIRVGSRKSPLALVQTHFVCDSLKECFPELSFEVIAMTTTGDEILDVALSKLGEKNLFTRELEQSLLNYDVDFVVHSLKDLPTQLPDNLVIGAVCRRDDPRDAVVMRSDLTFTSLAELPAGSVVGTSSLRRGAQLARKYPELTIKDVRGNLQTRFRKLDEDKGFDCLVLAAAGLERMKWTDRISELLPPTDCMYAVAQGAMAVECRHDDERTIALLSAMHDRDTVLRVIAERALLRQLEGGCSVPVAVHTEVSNIALSITAGVFSIGGAQGIIDNMATSLDSQASNHATGLPPVHAGVVAMKIPESDLLAAEKLGVDLATKMLAEGAREVLVETKAKMAAEVHAEQARRKAKKQQQQPA
ncbi:hypothetical protein CAPTEDRAFT_178034 [Capitella teleta]|uniref:hydroxymethylbilane synthase n=1 Tax=Capitella teleta TaxID=283909 RepID=R7TG82_CAPTE|nr:hypothetical protein CAPTEDRAFT_178034 [Capitella teleta]|eukprot:ELT90056.1 hypothetical protein CAPTEDRAFT_178034 [Capitella teleta]